VKLAGQAGQIKNEKNAKDTKKLKDPNALITIKHQITNIF